MKWRSLEESTSAPETRSLGEVYAERKALIAKYVSSDIQAVHARAVAELQDSGIAERALKPGSEVTVAGGDAGGRGRRGDRGQGGGARPFHLRENWNDPGHRSAWKNN